MYLLLAFAYLLIELHIPTLIPFATINNMSTSLVCFKAACQANPEGEGNFPGSYS